MRRTPLDHLRSPPRPVSTVRPTGDHGRGWSDRSFAVTILLLASGLVSGCTPPEPSSYTIEPPRSDCARAHDGDEVFLDVTADSGIDFEFIPGGDPEDPNAQQFGAGLATSDLDGDGRVDLILSNEGDPSSFGLNLGGMRFERGGSLVGAPGEAPAQGIVSADLDSDGDADILVLRDRGLGLFVNNGDASFSNQTAEAGFDVPARPLAVALADLNGDRWLDLYVCTFFSVDPLNLGGTRPPLHQRWSWRLGGAAAERGRRALRQRVFRGGVRRS